MSLQSEHSDVILPEPYKSPITEDGYFTYVYFKLNSFGEIVKVTQNKRIIIETRKIHKSVYERAKKLESNKFGNVKKGTNQNITIHEKLDAYIIPPQNFDNEYNDDLIGNMDDSYKLFQKKQMERKLMNQYSIESDKPKVTSYIPPNKRLGENVQDSSIKYNYFSIRINNLSSITKEQDVADLCYVFGNIKRVFLATNRETGRSKGYAFVTFYDKEHAKNAIQSLNGYGYDNLILHVEYSIERTNKN